MEDFKTYWKEKAQKRRKTWKAKSKRYAKHHTSLEDIRKEVFLPIDYTPGFELTEYIVLHFIKRNPIIKWQQGQFEFSENDLREAMIAQGADMGTFKIKLDKKNIVGKEPPQPQITRYLEITPNKVFDIEITYHAWLRRVYEICTDIETCKLTYGQATMVIRRYTSNSNPFAYYELIPCEQLVLSALLMQETDFYTINTATLLMEMAAEQELRQEELSYHAKNLKIRTMEAVTSNCIDFDLWDDKKLDKKIKEYVIKGYTLDKIMDQVLHSWKLGVQKFFEAITQRDIQDKALVFQPFGYFGYNKWTKRFVNQDLQPYLDSQGLQEAKINGPTDSNKQCIIKYQGHRVIIKRDYNPDCFLIYPYADEDRFLKSNIDNQHVTLRVLNLSAIAEYLKQVPIVCPQIAAMKEKVKERYNKEAIQAIEEKR